MNKQVEIVSKSIPLEKIKDFLETQLNRTNSGVKLIVKEPEVRLRSGLNPAVIVAIIGATGTACATLIAGLLRMFEKNPEKRTVIQGKSGARLEVPADTPPEKISKLLQDVKKLDLDQILIP
jgi:hypothetical protein